jgi:hypothetical protein
MTSLLLFAALLPCVYVTPGSASPATLKAAGISQLCDDNALAAREALPTPGITARPGVASPTRTPWIIANGWRFMRQPGGKYVYDVPAGKAALAAAEAYAYAADAVLKINASDVEALGKMLAFLERLPPLDLPAIADFAIVDDGSDATGEVLNLLVRRNLLFERVTAPSPRVGVNVVLGSPQYPREDAADPSALALKIRRALTDERRSLRVFGSEVVLCRLTGDGERARLHVINYGGREIEGLRLRVRGLYSRGRGHSAESDSFPLLEQTASDGVTEFSLARLGTYAVIDLTR